MLIDGTGMHWARLLGSNIAPGRPALFLDRDGVIVEEVGYLHRVEDLRLLPGVGEAICAANQAGMSVAVITNQSGIGRGYYGWEAFEAVQDALVSRLYADGARLDAVLACGIEPRPGETLDPLGWRKPGGGMVLHGLSLLRADARRSSIVGDRMSDLEAGLNGGLAAGYLVATGYGGQQMDAFATWRPEGFTAKPARDAPEAISLALASLRDG